MPTPPRLVAAILAVALLAAGCERSDPDRTIRPQWQRLTLPAPPGEPGRLMLRDATACAGKWYVVGAVGGPGGATRPAAWTSADAQIWTSVALAPTSYYGERNVLYAAGCRNGQVAAVGAKSGGAHGNPRVSTWHQRAERSLVEVSAPFEMYGGPKAVNVSRVAGGPSGWLIVGNRTSGAAAWVSPDSAEFDIIEAAPELASDRRGVTWASDVTATSEGWLVVGGILPLGRIDRDPLVWFSSDGRAWQRTTLPATKEYEELQRVVVVGGTPVGVGLRGRAFGAWRTDADGWKAAGGFGAPGSAGAPTVSGLTVAGGWLVATASDGSAHALWVSMDEGRSWRAMAAPVAMPAGADRDVSLLAAADGLLLSIDDGNDGGVWWTQAAREAE